MENELQNHLRVLLVDDDEEDYILIRDLLGGRSYRSSETQQTGFSIDWVPDYEAALRALAQNDYDVCLVDYRLGHRDGLELLREVATLDGDVPIIIITGQGSYDVDIEAMQAGAVDFLSKNDLTAPALERTLRYAVERKRSQEVLRDAYAELEKRVQERTRELEHANGRLENAYAELQEEFTRRDLAEQALRKAKSELEARVEEQTAAVRQQAEELNAIFMAMVDAVVVFDANGTLKYANPMAVKMLGFDPTNWTREEILDVVSFYLPDGSLVSINALPSSRALHGESVKAERLVLDSKKKEECTIIASASPIYRDGTINGAVVIWHDISEREHLIAQLEAERARLSTIIANAPGAIVVVDRENRIVLTNPVADQLYFRSIPFGENFYGQNGLQIYDLDGTPYEPQNMPLARSALHGETQINLEQMIIGTDGQRRYLLVNSAPILDRKGQLNGAIAIIQDITQRKQVEEENRQKATQIEVQQHLIQYREMERLHIAQELHDGPLQQLIGINYSLSNLISMLPTGEMGDGDLADALRTATYEIQDSLKQEIQDLRIVCSELRPPTLAPFGLEKAIRSHAESMQNRYPELNIRLELMHDGKLLPDRVRLALFRIYQELLNNVVRHAQASEVIVRFALKGGQAELEVKDNGCGFELTNRWLELARQGHLGLVGVKERAEAVKGNVSIVSGSGKGTSVQVVVPWNQFRDIPI